MTETPELRAALERLVYLRKIRELALAAFGTGDPKARLHNREVTRLAASHFDVEPSAQLARDVIQAMRAAGWRPVRHARIVWWKGIRRL